MEINKKLVERLERIFPDLELTTKGKTWFDESGCKNYSPPVSINWYDIVEKLNEKGLIISNK